MSTNPFSKSEALQKLSDLIRSIRDEGKLLKLLALYGKLSGWDKDKSKEPSEESRIDAIVLELERKRKAV
jgi:hypothetical protein